MLCRWDSITKRGRLLKVKENGQGGGRDENIQAKDYASYVGLRIAVQGQ